MGRASFISSLGQREAIAFATNQQNKELPNVTVRGQQTGYSNGDKLFSGAMTWMHLVASDGIA